MRFGRRLDDDVISLCRSDLKLVHLYRTHVLPVRLNHAHPHPGNADVEETHRAAIDNAQANAFARTEKIFEAVFGRVAVDEISVGRSGHIGDVGRHHSHTRPHPAIASAQAIIVRPAGLLTVEILLALLELCHDRMRVKRAELAQQQHIVAIGLHRIGTRRIDNDRAVMARLFLEIRVAMPPVGARLA